MTDEYNENTISEDMLEIFHEEELEPPRKELQKHVSLEELPQPIYRLKMLHSSETFHAHYEGQEKNVHFLTRGDLEKALEGPRPSIQAACVCCGALDSAQNQNQDEASETEGFLIPCRSLVVTPTKYGSDLAEVLGVVRDLSVVSADELMLIERPATVDDYRHYRDNLEREKDALQKCRERIEAHHLPMKLVAAHCLLEDSKILFFFTAESRVDFRDLVKDLVNLFHARIELRQIGVRDEARVTGGCGVCGRILCCHGVSDKLNPVSIKMAKDQNLSLNSLKISGPCGRLLCCLSYEHHFYRDARKELPSEGARFAYDGTLFKVIEVNVLSNKVRIAGEDGRLLDMEAERLKYLDGHWTILAEEVS